MTDAVGQRVEPVSDTWEWGALCAAAALLMLPLWLVEMPAMPDYPAHLASFHLIGGGLADPDLARVYHLDWHFIPNLASELTLPWLAHLVGLGNAARLFLSVTIALWVVGPALVHRALYGRIGVAPLAGAMFAYNANFIWGFFNCDFAAGFGFVLFAAWIGMRVAPRRNATVRFALFSAAVTILYFSHIFAAATLLLLIAAFEIAQGWRDPRGLPRRATLTAAIFLPAAAAFLFLRPPSAGGELFAFNLADTMRDRWESLLQYHFDDPADLLPALLGAALLLALVTGRARLHPMLWPALGLLLIGSLCAPEWAMGGWAVHLRLPPVFAVMLFAATELRMRENLKKGIAVAALLLLASNAAALARDWRTHDPQFREFRTALQALPRGQRLLTVLDGDAIGDTADQPYWHMAEYAITDRGDATALMFTTRGQHVVQVNRPFAANAAATAEQGSPPDIDELAALAAGDMDDDEDFRDAYPYLDHFQCHYDEAVVIHLGGPRSAVPAMLRLRHAGSFFALYDIRPDPTCRR